MSRFGISRSVTDVARHLGIDPAHVVPYSDNKAKIRLEALDSMRPQGRLILVSAITPTGAGEGKTTSAIGLAQGLAARGHRAALVHECQSIGDASHSQIFRHRSRTRQAGPAQSSGSGCCKRATLRLPALSTDEHGADPR